MLDFAFMGGSMGSVVGEKIARALLDSPARPRGRRSSCRRCGGARMQESLLSLMQMAKTSAVLAPSARGGHPLHLDPDQPDHRRRHRQLRARSATSTSPSRAP